MAMIPIIKLPHPNGAGKCYPLSVFESLLNTADINVNNNIGGYKKGDVIEAQTPFDSVFRKLMEEEAPSIIVTNFDDPNDVTAPSSKLVNDSITALSIDLSGKENVGVAANLVQELRDGEVYQNRIDIDNNTQAILTINGDKDIPGSIKYAVDQLESGKVQSNIEGIQNLEISKQDKLEWLSTQYDPTSNKATTAADLKATEDRLEKKFAKVTNFRGIFYKNPGEEAEDCLRRCVTDPANGDFAIVDSDEFIYATQDLKWHLLGNLDGYIKQGTGSLRNNDFNPQIETISQDKITGLVTLNNNVDNIIDTTIPAINRNISTINDTLSEHKTEIDKRETIDNVTSKVSNAINQSNNYTDNEIAKLNVPDSSITRQFVVSVSQNGGTISVNRRELTNEDLPVATSNKPGAIKPGINCVVDADGTLNVSGGSGGIGNVVGPDSSAVNHIATFNSTNGKVIKDSGFTIEQSVPADAKFTDTTYTGSNGIDVDGTVIKHSNNISQQSSVIFVKLAHDSNGHITNIEPVTANDIPTLTPSKITGLGKFATVSTLEVNDIPDLPTSKITGLGKFATVDSLTENDIPTLNISKINELTEKLSNKAEISSLGELAYKNNLESSDIPSIPSTKVNGLGRLATISYLTADDIPSLTLSKITDAGSLAYKNSLVANDIPDLTLDKITDAGDLAYKNSLSVNDIPELPSTKINDLGKFATAKSLSVDDIPSLPSSKINDLGELATLNRDDLGELAFKNSLTKTDVGLGNIDNTSDINKPVSTAVQNELNLKEDIANLKSLAYRDSLDKSDVGLNLVDNTSDINKPISTATQNALNLKEDIANLGELAYKDSLYKTDIGLGNVDNTSDENKPVSIAVQSALNLKADLENLGELAFKNSLTKTDVGLGNVDNTSDANKPVSTATQNAINALKFSATDKANLTTDDGIIDAVKSLLIKLGMKSQNITT